MIYEKILKEKSRLEQQVKDLQLQIQKLPAGKLICASNRKWQKWYVSDGHTSTYLPKKERVTAEKLALKKYLIQQLDNTIHELKSINLYLQNHDSTAEQKRTIYSHRAGIQRFIRTLFLSPITRIAAMEKRTLSQK